MTVEASSGVCGSCRARSLGDEARGVLGAEAFVQAAAQIIDAEFAKIGVEVVAARRQSDDVDARLGGAF